MKMTELEKKELKRLFIHKTYRLEFNESSKNFHLDNYTHQENTHGWCTIMESCTDLEFFIFESYVNRIPNY